MKGVETWSYAPYRPLLFDVGDIYICRVVPASDSIHLEWMPAGETYRIFYRLRGAETFQTAGETVQTAYNIIGLKREMTYEFYVQAGVKRSRIRLARCGDAVGSIVNYLHPDDEAYSFSGRYLCSPSLLRHPDGYWLASMDVFAAGEPQNLTLIFRSDNDGQTWHYVSELFPCFWGKLFLHKGELYMLGCSTEYGDLLIGKSNDGGRTFGVPTVIARGANGKNGVPGFHTNPQNMMVCNHRLWRALEWGSWGIDKHVAMVISCDIDDDLLKPSNWSISAPVAFSPDFAFETKGYGKNTAMIEGTLAVAPDGTIVNVMRFHQPGKAIAFTVCKEHPQAAMTYRTLIDLPINRSKFIIQYDAVGKLYYTIGCYVYDESEKSNARNWLVLLTSPDLIHWSVKQSIYDYHETDHKKIGFQYVDFCFDGEDIAFLCRTAINGAKGYHDSNYLTFDRIKDFRKL